MGKDQSFNLHLERLIPAVLHTMFVDLWFVWPILILMGLLKAFVRGFRR